MIYLCEMFFILNKLIFVVENKPRLSPQRCFVVIFVNAGNVEAKVFTAVLSTLIRMLCCFVRESFVCRFLLISNRAENVMSEIFSTKISTEGS